MGEYATYDEIFEEAWHEIFAPENAMPRILKRKFDELGITLTEDQWSRVRSQLESPKEGLQLDIDEEALIQAGFEPDEEGNFNVTLDLRDEADRFEKLEANLPEILGEAIPETVEEWASGKLQQFEDEAPIILETEGEMRESFRATLRDIWGEGLDYLELFLILVTEAGHDFASEYWGSEPDEPDYVFQAMIGLHARACQIGKEVHTLLKAGFADGAHARWRSLHEVSVIAKFIQDHGQETAERYLLHDSIESRKATLQHADYASRIAEPPPSEQDLQRLNNMRASLLERFGEAFNEPYGWAANVFAPHRPSFADIERKTDLDHWRPYYRLASHNVHANPKGILFRLGSAPGTDMLLAGPSIYGLADPAHGAAISLLQITFWLLAYEPTIDRLVRLHTLMKLERKIGELFFTTHWKLESGTEEE